MIGIFDIGKTNKKFILFDRNYDIIEETITVIETKEDEDGDPCEDLAAVSIWIKEQLAYALDRYKNKIKAINFSTHGASLVHIDAEGKSVTPLYDYMKTLGNGIADEFYDLFDGRKRFSTETGSPALGMLNSGLQLFWLKNHKPKKFKATKKSLHFPQYLNYLFSNRYHAEYSSIGCHTGLWDFAEKNYHQWLKEENINHLLPQPESVHTYDKVKIKGEYTIDVGIGIHDSSAAILPFVEAAELPFVMLSTGTWSIALNPFFEGTLAKDKYEQDCLYYLLSKERKVAASRLLLGKEFKHQVNKLEKYFGKTKGYFKSVMLEKPLLKKVLAKSSDIGFFFPEIMQDTGPCPKLKGTAPDLSKVESFEVAYYKLLLDLIVLQKKSIELIHGDIKRLYVSGGFMKNTVFMELLQGFLPDWKIFYIPENNRASALGAAVALHEVWQKAPLPETVDEVYQYKHRFDLDLSNYPGN